MNDYPSEVASNWNKYGRFNRSSTERFLSHLPQSLVDKRIVDLGCGNGDDCIQYKKLGARSVVGIDRSGQMVRVAKKRVAGSAEQCIEYLEADFMHTATTPFSWWANCQVDWVVSKWALQHAPNLDVVYENIVWNLSPKGNVLLMMVHPMRHFMEKKRGLLSRICQPIKKKPCGKNYFKQETVKSVLFNGALTVYEPSHTMEQILSPYFLRHFDLQVFEEGIVEGCAVVNGDIYPSYVLIKAQLRD